MLCDYLLHLHIFLLIKHDNTGQVFNYHRVTSNSVEENPLKSEWSGLTVTANYQGTIFAAVLHLTDMS